MTTAIIDAWLQHPTARFANQPIFDSLRRWTGGMSALVGELPVSATLAAMDAGGVQQALVSAWHGPHGDLISNDEVAAHPDD